MRRGVIAVKRNRKAKIVATLGPASSDAQTIRRLFEAGVDVFRLNFSHGSHEDHAASHGILRALERDTGRPICILQDLQGPKIRIGTLKDGGFELARDQTVRFVPDGEEGDAQSIPLPHPEIFAAIMPQNAMLIDDGKLRLEVTAVSDAAIEARVVAGGDISNRKGVNLPDTLLDLSPLTDKDREDLAFGLDLGVDYVALSFVQRPSDVIEAQGLIAGRAQVMTKVEKPSAVERIDDILALSDAIMVARGDLGVEIPPEDVPGRQKELIRACRLAGKPVIVATQMLDSMVHTPTPTRAEASDVATAIYDGADAVMLSAESATGDYPVETVNMMDRIITKTEQHSAYQAIIHALDPDIEPSAQHAVSAAAAFVAQSIDAKAIVAFTSSGTTAYRISRERPEVLVVTVTPHLRVARRLALLWGAYSVQSTEIQAYDEMVDEAVKHALKEGIAETNDQIVIVSGVPFGVPGSTNNLRVATV